MFWFMICLIILLKEVSRGEKWFVKALIKLTAVFACDFMVAKAPAEFFLISLMILCAFGGFKLYSLEIRRKRKASTDYVEAFH